MSSLKLSKNLNYVRKHAVSLIGRYDKLLFTGQRSLLLVTPGAGFFI